MSDEGAGLLWRLRDLSPADVPEVQALMDASEDYFLTCFGLPPGPHEAEQEFEALPPGATRRKKRVVGVEGVDGRLLGVIDEVADWPRVGTLMLGLVLLRPEARGRGIGRAVLEARRVEWRQLGLTRVRVGVVAANVASLRFFERYGFARVQHVSRDDAPHPYEIEVLEREL